SRFLGVRPLLARPESPPNSSRFLRRSSRSPPLCAPRPHPPAGKLRGGRGDSVVNHRRAFTCARRAHARESASLPYLGSAPRICARKRATPFRRTRVAGQERGK